MWLKNHRKIQMKQGTILHQKPMTLDAFQSITQEKLRDREMKWNYSKQHGRLTEGPGIEIKHPNS